MPRKGPAPKRPVVADPVYGAPIVSQLVNKILLDGKKGLAERIVYDALAGVAAKNGGLFSSWGLSEEYRFEDVDGRRPHWRTAFAEHLKTHHYDAAKAAYRWIIAPAD